ncbi:MAG: hypothetical protein K2O24_02865 [Muribaculaceae bacterium]|nr:hypothetical protein [Muribaculaceae bacterium]
MEKMSAGGKGVQTAGPGFGRDDVAAILGEYVGSGRFREDFESLTPARRIGLMERMLPFVIGRVKSFDPLDTDRGHEPEIDDILRAIMEESERTHD